MTVKRAREILGDQIADMTDEEVMEMNLIAGGLADIALNFASKRICEKYSKTCKPLGSQ